jgi:dihydropteroate synthase
VSIPLRDDRVTVFGVLNATPDSFSDGGRFVDPCERLDLACAIDAAALMVEAGADVLDVGGESTRPGALEVAVAQETARTAPILEALAKRFDVPLSIDTRKAEVAEAAINAGASIVNDVSGLRFDAALAEVVARTGSGLVIGHLRGTPATMQVAPHFDDVVTEVADELAVSVALAREAGVPEHELMVDPGIGFGKELVDNLRLLSGPDLLRERLGLPVMVGPSRKSFLGRITGAATNQREVATYAACAVAVFAGADAVRVHDVAGARDAVAVALALRKSRAERGGRR